MLTRDRRSKALAVVAPLLLRLLPPSPAHAMADAPPAVAGMPAVPIPTMSLAQALDYARKHQPSVRAALARIREQLASTAISRAQWQPFVGASAQFIEATASNTTASYVGTDVVDLPRIGGTRSYTADGASLRPYASTLAAAGLRQEIFDFGRIVAQSAAADAAVVVARHDADAIRLDVDYSVEEAYFAVSTAKAIVKAAEDAYQRSRVHRDDAAAGVKAGLRPPIDLTRADADLTRFDTGRIRARGGLLAAQAVLAAAVGAPDPFLDAAEPPTASPQLPAFEEAIRQAEQHDPRLQETIARLRLQEQETLAVAAELRPNLHLSATFSGRAGGASPSTPSDAVPVGNGFLPDVPNWDIGLVFRWPIFDPMVRARREASRSAEQVRREEIALARQQVATAVAQAYLSVNVARQALPALQRELEAAQANYAQADARFRAELGTSVELSDAEALRADAEIRLALGVFDVAKARAGFARAIAEGL